MLVSSNLFKKSSKSRKVRCEICANYCKIADGAYGICKQHKNINGELFDESFGIVSSLNADPIEKKPLYHFLPGTLTYSVGGFGCNMGCLHCQNYMISKEFDKISDRLNILPETIVENAISQGCKSIAWTYNEPTIHLPFNKKTSLLGRRKNLKIIYVSNGYMSSQALSEILEFVDAFNIDLKSMSQNFYKKICGADLNIVLDNLKRIYEADKHLEITNLIINDYNDSAEEITKLANFIVDNLGCNVPLHFSRAFPYYKLNDIAPTSEDKLFEAKKIANECGLEYVYIGNLECDTNTYCSNCGETLLKRNSYSTEVLNKNKKCMKCGKCSATCPSFNEMDIKPHQFVSYVANENIEELVNSKSLWKCLSCFACVERCPRDVKPGKLIDAARQLVVRQKGQNYLTPDEIPELLDPELPQQLLVSAFRRYRR